MTIVLAIVACAPRGDDLPRNRSLAEEIPSTQDSVRPEAISRDAADERPEPMDSAHGSIVITGIGPKPDVVLSSAGALPIVLTGELEPELRQLAGAKVAVFGESTGTTRTTMRVSHYDVLEIDGQRPLLGTVISGGRRVLFGADSLDLIGLPQPLPNDAKVWIVGRRDGKRIYLQSWGLIRMP